MAMVRRLVHVAHNFRMMYEEKMHVNSRRSHKSVDLKRLRAHRFLQLNTLKSSIHLLPCVQSLIGTLYDNAHFMSAALRAQCFSLYTCICTQRGFLCAAQEALMCSLHHGCTDCSQEGTHRRHTL